MNFWQFASDHPIQAFFFAYFAMVAVIGASNMMAQIGNWWRK